MAGKDGDKGAKLFAAERRVKVLELRKSGASIRAIATHLKEQGYHDKASPATVHKDLKDALKNLKEKEIVEAEEMRQIEIERLDALWLAHWSLGLKGNVGNSWVLLAIAERRAHLLGLDAPKKVDLKVNPRELLAKLLGVSPEQLPNKDK